MTINKIPTKAYYLYINLVGLANIKDDFAKTLAVDKIDVGISIDGVERTFSFDNFAERLGFSCAKALSDQAKRRPLDARRGRSGTRRITISPKFKQTIPNRIRDI